MADKSSTSTRSDDSISSEKASKIHARRRKQLAARFFTYGVMAVATLVGVIFCVSWAMGYRFDLINGVSQVALLQFNSYPTGATVEVNDKRVSGRTPNRSNVETGNLSVLITRQGYRDWSKTVNALPSSVRWLDYVRLVPREITTESIHTFSKVDDILSSPDCKWAILLDDKRSGSITLVDLTDPTDPSYIDATLDSDQVSSADDQEFKLLEWDSDSRYVLIEHRYGDSVEHLEYDRQDHETRNLTRKFGMTLTDPHFSGTNGDVIFALTGSDLRKIDYGNDSISAPLANNVTDYVLYSNSRIAFTTRTESDEKTKQAVSIYDDGKVEKIKEYDGDAKIQIDFSRVNDVDYLAIARNETVAIYPDPLESENNNPDSVSTDVAYLSSPGGIDWMQISDNGRFVLAGHGKKVVSYDIETEENYSFEMERIGEPVWLDNYHILDIKDDAIQMIEFDGQNAEKLVSGDLPAFLSHDGKYLFSLDATAEGVVLQRSNMTVERR